MISWLKGEQIESWSNNNRSGVLVSCSGVGYEVQTLIRDKNKFSSSRELILWIHQVQREDGSSLIGFLDKLDRNFFRKLISVNGVGPQLAISLLEKKNTHQLIFAIDCKDIPLLISCPGIGKRLAERLVIELHGKLEEFLPSSKTITDTGSFPKDNLDQEISNEVHSALTNLGYKESEINNAFAKLEIEASNNSKGLQEGRIRGKFDFDGLFRETLLRINTESRIKAT